MRIGDHDLPADMVRSILRSYAIDHHRTVLYYDLAGDTHGRPGPNGAADPVNAVTLADAGRLVAVGARLQPADVATLLSPSAADSFSAVPADARLEEWEPGTSLDDAITQLYEQFRRPGLGRAKRSKLLHAKRPWLVPIYDTRVANVYSGPTARLRAAGSSHGAAWWEPIKRDLVDGAEELGRLAADLTAR